ncbi:MAG: glycosyltransferase family 4 protein [Deltaproteobacteria bacterium]|nr:glycosyltransferase family 4 protein [Deltaproteobacteria bacterium]
MKIVTVIPTLNPYGGVVSVANLLSELMELGHDCTLITLSKYAHKGLGLRLEPAFISDWDRIGELAPHDADILIATSWETVQPVLDILEHSKKADPVYFVQDIEVDFIDPDDHEQRERARRTYFQIPTLVVKTAHLQTRLEKEMGREARRIRPGMNLDIFYPRDVQRDGNKRRLLGFARPDAPNDQRGFSVMREVFGEIYRKREDITIGFFGQPDMPDDLGFPFRNFGRVAPSQLPDIYSWADVYLDSSRFHGFGRTGVEAMACGTPPVLSDSGGIREYARDGENALIVPVADIGKTVNAILRLLDDRTLWDRLRLAGLETIQGYSDTAAAKEMLAIFESLKTDLKT